jgi:hypothetical protein
MRVRKLRTPSPVPTPKPAKGCERMQTVLPGLSHDAVGVRRVRELHLHSAARLPFQHPCPRSGKGGPVGRVQIPRPTKPQTKNQQ